VYDCTWKNSTCRKDFIVGDRPWQGEGLHAENARYALADYMARSMEMLQRAVGSSWLTRRHWEGPRAMA
jgi:hypothetical protein